MKNNRILVDILDIYKNYDEVAYNNKLFEVGKEAQSRIRDFQLSNIKINRNKSCVMDMDKEMRPMSRGRSSCGNRDNQSLNSTTRTNISNLNNSQGLQHEVNVLKFGDEPLDNDNEGESEGEGMLIDNIMPITRKLSISELRRIAQDESDKGNNDIITEEKPLKASVNTTPFKDGNDKENTNGLQRKNKLPPMLPPTKRKGKLEPLKEKNVKIDNQNGDELDDIFKGGDSAFELSFSDT